MLGGIDADGHEVTNEVSYLVLDIIEELGISDFPTSVRLNRHTSDAFLHRVAEVMRYGGGVLAVYNEELVIDAFVKDGYDKKEDRLRFFVFRDYDTIRIARDIPSKTPSCGFRVHRAYKSAGSPLFSISR